MLTALMVATTSSPVSSALWVGSSEKTVAVGPGEEDELDARGDQEPGREHLAAELGQRVELEEVVEHPDRADQRPGDQHDPGVAEDERAAGGEERQLPGHEVRRHEAAQHRQPAEVGDRLVVHVAVAHLGDRAGADRDLAGHDREQVGDRGGHQEDEDVLPHSASSAARPRSRGASGSGRGASGSSTALSWSRLSAPTRSTRPGVPVDVDDRRGLAARRGAGVDEHLDVLAEHLLGLVGLGRGRAAGAVGGADRERAGALEDLQGDRVVGHPHRDGAAGVAEVPLQRGWAWQTRVSGPGQNSSTRARAHAGHPDRERVERGRRRDQDRRRHVAAAALGVEQLGPRPCRRRRRPGRRRCRSACTTRPPRWMARLAASTAASRSSSVVVG